MKRLAILCVLLVPSALWADSISNYIYINGATGSVVYNPAVPSIFGSGSTSDGGTFTFGASRTPLYGGKFATGFLNVNAANFTLSGMLSKIYFNPITGLFQGSFVGQLRENGLVLHIYHAVFYETVSLGQGTLQSGHLVFSTAPEPESLWLQGTGLAGIGGIGWRKALG